MTKKSRAKYECPPKLEKLIKAANLLPRDYELKPFSEIYNEAYNKLPKVPPRYGRGEPDVTFEGWQGMADFYFQVLVEATADNFELRQLILDVAAEEAEKEGGVPVTTEEKSKHTFNIAYWYSACYEWARINGYELISFAYYSKARRKGVAPPSYDAGRIQTVVWFSPENKVQSGQLSYFLDAINNIDGDRLRVCEICEKVFWAKRSESETCSSKCFNALRQKRYRQKLKDEKGETT